MFRLIDANLNRLSEGLRLLEDVSRFILNDAALSSRLKALRHDLLSNTKSFQCTLLTARDSEGDVTAFSKESMSRSDVNDVVTANARRVTESLRVLEEFAKLPDMDMDPMKFKRARFAIYEIEKELSGKVLRRGKRIAGLYVIIDIATLGNRDAVETCKQAINGGAKGIQLREKQQEKKEMLITAKRLQEVCTQHNVLFSVNDHLDVALGADADCLHLGQGDFPISDARRILPINMLLGCSVSNIVESNLAESEGADYISVASIYSTRTKEDAITVGLEQLRTIKKAISLPVVAIGGINADNIHEVLKAGANAVAVISAVLRADNVEQATYKLAKIIEEYESEGRT
jgi:thiamine-phosphate pyrophosphorylase